MDHIISMFLDNELGLDDKIDFISKVHGDKTFRDQTVELLEQEKFLRSDVVERTPQIKLPLKKSFVMPLWRPIAAISPQTIHRFVIYRPDISHAEISGSFTNWQNRPMDRVGDTGYWEITLNVPKGEHRFIYILDGQQRFPDPTLPDREEDDFGGENSILSV